MLVDGEAASGLGAVHDPVRELRAQVLERAGAGIEVTRAHPARPKTAGGTAVPRGAETKGGAGLRTWGDNAFRGAVPSCSLDFRLKGRRALLLLALDPRFPASPPPALALLAASPRFPLHLGALAQGSVRAGARRRQKRRLLLLRGGG